MTVLAKQAQPLIDVTKNNPEQQQDSYAGKPKVNEKKKQIKRFTDNVISLSYYRWKVHFKQILDKETCVKLFAN